MTSGAPYAPKVAHRTAGENLVGVSILWCVGPATVHAVLVLLNCETNFGACNALFAHLVADVVHNAALLAEAAESEYRSSSSIHHFLRAQLLDAPLLSADGPTPSRPLRRTAGIFTFPS